MAEEGAEEDEDEWEGDPDQELQRKAGPHLGVGPLVGCGDTCLGLGRACLSSCVHSTRSVPGVFSGCAHSVCPFQDGAALI